MNELQFFSLIVHEESQQPRKFDTQTCLSTMPSETDGNVPKIDSNTL